MEGFAALQTLKGESIWWVLHNLQSTWGQGWSRELEENPDPNQEVRILRSKVHRIWEGLCARSLWPGEGLPHTHPPVGARV